MQPHAHESEKPATAHTGGSSVYAKQLYTLVKRNNTVAKKVLVGSLHGLVNVRAREQLIVMALLPF